MAESHPNLSPKVRIEQKNISLDESMELRLLRGQYTREKKLVDEKVRELAIA